MTREQIKAAADASWGFDQGGPEHLPGVPQVGEVWGDPRKPETWRYILSAGPEWMSWRTFGGEVWASEPRQGFDEWFKEVKAFNIRGMVEDYLQRGDNRGVNWWTQVAEAKQSERDEAYAKIRRWRTKLMEIVRFVKDETLTFAIGDLERLIDEPCQ